MKHVDIINFLISIAVMGAVALPGIKDWRAQKLPDLRSLPPK